MGSLKLWSCRVIIESRASVHWVLSVFCNRVCFLSVSAKEFTNYASSVKGLVVTRRYGKRRREIVRFNIET